MTAQRDFPTHVVRFFGNTEFALDTIAHRHLTFVHASKLNDPFDPYFFFETDFEESYAAIIDYIHKKHPNDLSWFIQQVPSGHWKEAVKNIREKLGSNRNETYILSASAPLGRVHPTDNLYMWGHYGNGHRGLAIELDTHEVAAPLIDEHRKKTGATIEARGVWTKVEYSDCLPPLTCKRFFEFFKNEREGNEKRTRLELHYDAMARTKANAWKNENEWRMLWHNNETRLKIQHVAISERAVSAVYIGQNASESFGKDVLFEVKRNFPSAKIYKASKRHGAFAVNFDVMV